MFLGIMTRVFSRKTLKEVANGVCATGLKAVQLNLRSAGLETLPAQLELEAAGEIGAIFSSRGLVVAAVSGTFNTIHPDFAIRTEGIRRLGVLASRCHALGSNVITLCTGTRDPDNMWRYHVGNREPSAWEDLLATMRKLVRFAEEFDITLAFEPEVVNVVNSAEKAKQLLEAVASPRLRVAFDPANLIRPSDLSDTRSVLRKAIAHLGPYIALSHAKDVAPPDPGGTECRRVSLGNGVLDYKLYLDLLKSAQFRGALIMHDLEEAEVPCAKARLDTLIEAEAS